MKIEPLMIVGVWSLAAALSGPKILAQDNALGVIRVGVAPVAVAINPATNQAFVLNRGSQDLMVINLANRTVTGKYQVGGIPEGIAVNPRTNFLVVASLNGAVTIIDHARGGMVATVPAGKAPSRVAIDADKNTALVTNFNGRNMVVIDLGLGRVIKTIPLSNGPLGVTVLEGKRRAVVACQYDMQLLQINLESYEVEQKLLLGRYLSEVAWNPATGQVLAGNPSGNGMVSVYDPATNAVLSTIPVGAGPLSIAIYPKRNVAVVAEYNDSEVTLVDLERNRVVKSIPVAKGPLGVAVQPETGIAVVVSKHADSATFLDLNAILGSPGSE